MSPSKVRGYLSVMPWVVMVICMVMSIWTESTSSMAVVAPLRMSSTRRRGRRLGEWRMGTGVAVQRFSARRQAITSRAIATRAVAGSTTLFHHLLLLFTGIPTGRNNCPAQRRPGLLQRVTGAPCQGGGSAGQAEQVGADAGDGPGAIALSAGDQVGDAVGVGDAVAGLQSALPSAGRAAVSGWGGG